jgi:4-cresol dehydrogenase (hydroxylating) flavoprotein subunit
VQEVVRIAARFRCPLYTISGGKNWGLGDACPTGPGQTIVDLRRLNAIREINTELGYAVVEAGVTQQQLYERLREDAPNLMFDATGAGPEATIVGNIMERGFGHSPYGDRYHHSCNYEVVLADGELLRTGFGQFDNCKTAHLLKAGLGPSLDGLFTQSNLGVVTSLTVWLMPKPERLEAFAFSVVSDEALPDIIEALRPLRMNGVLTSTIHIANDLRVISSKRQYPWGLAGGVTPLPEGVRRSLQREYGVGAWNVLGGLYGSRAMIRGAQQALRKALRGIARPQFINDYRLTWAHQLLACGSRFGVGKRLSKRLASASSVFALLKGEPVADHLAGCRWRNPAAASGEVNDPLDRGDGLIWLSPTLPMTSRDAAAVNDLARDVLEAYGFDALITFVTISGRAMCSPLTITYDAKDKGSRARAAACYDCLATTMIQSGYYPYRLGIQSMDLMRRDASGHAEVSTFKRALDPLNLLAPGRY